MPPDRQRDEPGVIPDHTGSPAPAMKTVETGWQEALVVCRKCQKRMGDAFGTDRDQPFRKAVREALKASGRRGRVGLVQAGCFGVCPKRGVTLMRSSRPDELVVVTPDMLFKLLDRE